MAPQPNICEAAKAASHISCHRCPATLARVHAVPNSLRPCIQSATPSQLQVLISVTCCQATLQDPGPLGGLLTCLIRWALAAAAVASHPPVTRCA
jgi:hypothetical protein